MIDSLDWAGHLFMVGLWLLLFGNDAVDVVMCAWQSAVSTCYARRWRGVK